MLLQQVSPMPATVLDVGSGSGILALAALRLGAERAVCLDTDPLAVEATMANAAANGLATRVVARRGTLDAADATYHLLLANLVASTLIEVAGSLAAHAEPGGTLVAGGIIAGRADEVLAALTNAGFALKERLDEGEWASLRLRRDG
jgi:ribosomal protein L11 methyltransferase